MNPTHVTIEVQELDRIRNNSKILGWILSLRDGEGDAVTILCDNPDGPPNCAIEVCADWTDWDQRRFSGATLEECLEQAILTKEAVKVSNER